MSEKNKNTRVRPRQPPPPPENIRRYWVQVFNLPLESSFDAQPPRPDISFPLIFALYAGKRNREASKFVCGRKESGHTPGEFGLVSEKD